MAAPKKSRRPRAPKRAPDFEVRSRAVPRDLFPGGVVRFSVGATGAEGRARRAELRKLVTWRAWDVLRAIQEGALDAGNVAASLKSEGESALGGLRESVRAANVGALPTLDEERTAYLEWYKSGRREEHSVKQVTSRLKVFCEIELPGIGPVGALPVARLTPALAEQAINQRWAASATREAIRGAVSGLYTWSVERERIRAKQAGEPPRWDENPASGVEAYERRARVVTAAERQVIALLAHAEIYQAAYVRAFVHLGLREDELIHTRLHLDLDTETWLWRIQGRGPDERHGCLQCKGSGWTPKSKRGWRTLLVPAEPAELRAVLLDYLEAYPCEEGGFVFRNPRTGRPWDAKALDDDFKRLCTRAEVKYGRKEPGGITLHDLRATCATRLVQAKERESVIAALLGDTVQTIVNTYVRLEAQDLAECVSRGPAYPVLEAQS